MSCHVCHIHLSICHIKSFSTFLIHKVLVLTSFIYPCSYWYSSIEHLLSFPLLGDSVPYLEAQASNGNRGLIGSPSLSFPNISVQMPCRSVPNPFPCQLSVSHSPPPALIPPSTLNPPPISHVNPLNHHSMITHAKNNIVKPSTKLTMLATNLTEPITKSTYICLTGP